MGKVRYNYIVRYQLVTTIKENNITQIYPDIHDLGMFTSLQKAIDRMEESIKYFRETERYYYKDEEKYKYISTSLIESDITSEGTSSINLINAVIRKTAILKIENMEFINKRYYSIYSTPVL